MSPLFAGIMKYLITHPLLVPVTLALTSDSRLMGRGVSWGERGVAAATFHTGPSHKSEEVVTLV